jgi:hypothetical protein
LRVAEKGIPTKFGGSCSAAVCQAFEKLAPSFWGFPFYPEFEVSSNYVEKDQAFSFKINFLSP